MEKRGGHPYPQTITKISTRDGGMRNVTTHRNMMDFTYTNMGEVQVVNTGIALNTFLTVILI